MDLGDRSGRGLFRRGLPNDAYVGGAEVRGRMRGRDSKSGRLLMRETMTEKFICPICKSEAELINVGLFDGIGVRCKTHGEFEVADSVLAVHKDTEAARWEAALNSAKDKAKAAQQTWPRITTYDF